MPSTTGLAYTLFADVSEFQAPLDDSYPYPWLSIRSNDGTYRDHNFAANWDQARRMLDDGRLLGLIVYAVVRPNWQDSLAVHLDMQGEDRPDVVTMADVEGWSGQICGNHSDAFNGFLWGASDWRGGGPEVLHRVVAYFNPNADAAIWPTRPAVPFIVPAYGSQPYFPPGCEDIEAQMVAHQYTDGAGYGGGLPEGAPPFGNCDMNSADGLDPWQLRAALGIDGGSDVSTDYSKLAYEQLAGPDGHGWPQLGQNEAGQDLTVVDFLAKYKPAFDALLDGGGVVPFLPTPEGEAR